jgi:hypothetical protein
MRELDGFKAKERERTLAGPAPRGDDERPPPRAIAGLSG